MSISLIAAGTYATGASTTAVAGGVYQAGDALILHAHEAIGAGTLTTPAGWTLLSANSLALQDKLFGKIAASSSETIPSLTWSDSATAACSALYIFRGVDSAFTTSAAPGDRSANTTNNVLGQASTRTPTVDGSLVVFAGGRNKTVTTDAQVLSAPANFTMLSQVTIAGNAKITAGASYWIQTTATVVPANSVMSTSVTDTSQSNQGGMIFLAAAPPPSGGGGTGTTLFPPLKRKTYVFYDMYYPR